MEIIKNGDLNQMRKPKLFACKKCGCAFRADNTEYQSANQMEYCHDGISAKCKCPCCGSMVYEYRGG